jgi:hypothetical protein
MEPNLEDDMSMRLLGVVWILGLALSAGGCDGGGGGDLPTESELYGTWENIEDGEVRAFVFEASSATWPDLAGASMVFQLYFYPEGAAPVMVQRGTYEVTEGHLVTTLTWASEGAMGSVGTSYANILYSWSGDSFTMESTSTASGKRVFAAAAPETYQ